MAVSDWSAVSAIANSTTPGMNWAEGMSPPEINNGVREMMRQLKSYFSDPTAQRVSMGLATTDIVTFGGVAAGYFSGKATFLANGGAIGGAAMQLTFSATSQPAWLVGTNDGVNYFVSNPAAYAVASATFATTAGSANAVANGVVSPAKLTAGAPNWDGAGNVSLGGALSIGFGRGRFIDNGTLIRLFLDAATYLEYNPATNVLLIVKNGGVVQTY